MNACDTCDRCVFWDSSGMNGRISRMLVAYGYGVCTCPKLRHEYSPHMPYVESMIVEKVAFDDAYGSHLGEKTGSDVICGPKFGCIHFWNKSQERPTPKECVQQVTIVPEEPKP